MSALPLRLLAQLMVDKNVSGATLQRFRRLLGPRACGFVTAQQLRAELRDESRGAEKDGRRGSKTRARALRGLQRECERRTRAAARAAAAFAPPDSRAVCSSTSRCERHTAAGLV